MLRREKFWLLANLAGAMGYLWLASRTWIEPELRGEDVARGGDAIIWGMTALPVLITFVIANFIGSWRRHWDQRSRWPEMLIVALWLAVLGADRLMS